MKTPYTTLFFVFSTKALMSMIHNIIQRTLLEILISVKVGAKIILYPTFYHLHPFDISFI